MPFNVGQAIDNTTNKVVSTPGFERLFKSPLSTAIVLTIIIVLVVMFTFREATTEEPLLTLGIRAGFYIFFISLIVLIPHNKVLIQDLNKVNENSEISKIIDGSYSGIVANGETKIPSFEESVIPVHVKFDGEL